MNGKQTDLILEAIESAEKSLVVAKKLLGASDGKKIVGTFNGEFMITSEGKRYQVPPNYASKSMLIVGDILRLVEEGAQNKFKHIEKVERLKTSGVLTKKEGKWAVVTEQGSFWVLSAAVKYFQGEIGDEAEILIPQDYKKLKVSWAALAKVLRHEKDKKPPEVVRPSKVVEPTKVDRFPKTAKEEKEKKEVVKKAEKPLEAAGKEKAPAKEIKVPAKKEPPKAVKKEPPKVVRMPKVVLKAVKREPPRVVKKEIKKAAEKEVRGEIKVGPEEELR